MSASNADEPNELSAQTNGSTGASGATGSPGSRPLLLGWVAGAHGIRGRLKVKLADARSTSLRAGLVVQLGPDGPMRTIAEVSEPDARGVVRVALTGLRNREAAEPLRGTALFVDRQQLPALADDEYYLDDAIGGEVVDEAGAGLGRVVGITSNGAQSLLEVAWTDDVGEVHEWLLPALPGFVLDVSSGRVLARVPAGFLPNALTGGDEDDDDAREGDEPSDEP